MSLFGPQFYEQIFEPLVGRRVGYFQFDGNVGDDLGRQGARDLLCYFGVDFKEIWPLRMPHGTRQRELDELIISGGGNMGSDFYPIPLRQRALALGFGLPITVLPQTFIENEEDLSRYSRIFVRERRSLAFSERFQLAPDTAMALAQVPMSSEPEVEIGLFLRRDPEAKFSEFEGSLGDPAGLSATWEEYLELASRFRHIITDRLHFAIAALLQGGRATLLPNSTVPQLYANFLKKRGTTVGHSLVSWLRKSLRIGC